MTSQELENELNEIKTILNQILSEVSGKSYRFGNKKPNPSIYAGSFSLKQAMEEFTRTGNYEPVRRYEKRRAAQIARESKITATKGA